MKVRTVRRAKQITGTQVQVVKTSAVAGMRQMRCTACSGMMAPLTNHDGTSIYQCGNCGAKSTSRPM